MTKYRLCPHRAYGLFLYIFPRYCGCYFVLSLSDQENRKLQILKTTVWKHSLVPDMWKSANILPLPKTHPPRSIASDLSPISLTPTIAKVFETIVMKQWVNEKIVDIVDENHFRGDSWNNHYRHFDRNDPSVVSSYRQTANFRQSTTS